MNALTPVPSGTRVPFENLPDVDAHFQSRSRREGNEYDAIAMQHLTDAGATVLRGRHHVGSYPVDGEIMSPDGHRYLVFAHGNLGASSRQPGLQRADTLAKVAHRCLMLAGHGALPAIIVTSHLPRPNSTCAHQLADLHDRLGPWLADVVATTGDLPGFHRLQSLFTSQTCPDRSRAAPWWQPSHDINLLSFIDPSRSDA